VRLNLPDDLADRLQALAPDLPLDQVVRVALERVQDLGPMEPALVLTGKELRRIHDLLGTGSTRSAKTLVAAVQRLSDIQIGQIRLDFTPAEQEELKYRAERAGRTVREEAEAVVRGMHEQFFSQPMTVR
jgi:hypothetical protein